MNINEQILEIVSDPSFDNFTPFELKKQFEKKVGEDHLEIIDMVKVVCTQIKLLVKAGRIERSREDHCFSGIYVKTSNYHPKKSTQVDSSSSGLKEKHNSYKQRLLVGIGEAEEYKTLCQDHPELQQKLQPKYNNVREQNIKMLGKIRVIESLLNKMDT
jgi:hypothetical protein